MQHLTDRPTRSMTATVPSPPYKSTSTVRPVAMGTRYQGVGNGTPPSKCLRRTTAFLQLAFQGTKAITHTTKDSIMDHVSGERAREVSRHWRCGDTPTKPTRGEGRLNLLSGLDHTLPTNTVCSPLDLGHPGVGNRRENENGSIECRRICEIKSSEYMS